jgi:hypothetical protein
MFDYYEPHQFVDTLNFSFKSSHFEIWQNGKLIVAKKGSNILSAEKGTNDGEINISIFGTISASEIASTISFEKAFTLKDRIILVTIPNPSRRDIPGIISLRMTSGVTNPGKVYTFPDPYCCSLFTLKQEIEKVTFSFSNPERLLEFYK